MAVAHGIRLVTSIPVRFMLVWLLLLGSINPGLAAEGEKLAIFTFELYDTNGDGKINQKDQPPQPTPFGNY